MRVPGVCGHFPTFFFNLLLLKNNNIIYNWQIKVGFWPQQYFVLNHAKNTSPFMEREERCLLDVFKYYLHSFFLFKKGVIPMAKLERNFQSHLIKRLKLMFEGCIVMKTDPDYIQGIPDLLILFNDKWAALEVKRSNTAHKQPNQEYYVRLMDDMSFSRFICPENEEEVLYELQQTFFSRR